MAVFRRKYRRPDYVFAGVGICISFLEPHASPIAFYVTNQAISWLCNIHILLLLCIGGRMYGDLKCCGLRTAVSYLHRLYVFALKKNGGILAYIKNNS